jgi:VWFA-related protein
MEKLFCRIWVVLLIVELLCGLAGLRSSTAAEVKKKSPATAQNSPPQEQKETPEPFKFKVKVDLVTTDVTVIGNPTSDLRAEDFTILDNGKPQEVSHFSQDQIPLAVALVVDTSLTTQRYLPVLQIAGGSALRHLTSDDQIALYSFNMTPKRVSNLTNDRVQLAKEIGKFEFKLGTDIYYAIHEAARYLREKAPNRRRAILLVSDNCYYGMSDITSQRARNSALEAAATMYSIRTPGLWRSDSNICVDPEVVQKLAEDTGGELVDTLTWTSLPEALEKAILRLRKQYTLGFNPSASGAQGSFHELAVKLASEDRCPGCRVLSRAGYFEGVTAPLPAPEKLPPAPKRTAAETDQMLIQQSILTAGTYEVDWPGLPFTVATALQKDSNGQPQVKVDLNIDSKLIKFNTVDGKHACKLHITIFYVNAGGKILGSEWKILDAQLKEETYWQAMKSGMLYSTIVPVKTEKQMIKIVVYDEMSDRAGSKSLWLAETFPQ